MGEIAEQANFWNENISPILSYDPAFVEWLNICDQNEPNRTPDPDMKAIYGHVENVPSQAFSIQEDPYEDNKINKGRCFAGVFDPDSKLLPLFTDTADNFVPMFVNSLLSKEDIGEYVAYALGIDMEKDEKKVYLIKDSTAALAYTFKNDELIETKSYEADEFDTKIWYCHGERGDRKRIGFAQESDNQMQESYENLTYVVTKFDETRDLARQILSSNLFFLDNISHSAERGTTLYFD